MPLMTRTTFPPTGIRAVVRSFARGILVLAALVIPAWLLLAWLEARSVRVERRTIRDPRVPAALHGTVLAFAADVHAGPIFGETRVRHLVRTINAEKPSLILLGGDYVGGNANGAAKFYPHISGLEAPLGIFAVLGNHDTWEGVEQARAGFAAAGITVLENDQARFETGDGSLVIAGLEDEWTGQPDATTLTSGVGNADFGVLVAHNPDSLESVLSRRDNPWALMLAGHTHGGQVAGFYWLLPRKPSRFGARFKGGWSAEGGVPLLVSNGVGAVTVPLRFLAPPQIHIITLERGRSSGPDSAGYSPR